VWLQCSSWSFRFPNTSRPNSNCHRTQEVLLVFMSTRIFLWTVLDLRVSPTQSSIWLLVGFHFFTPKFHSLI
jgi:hypothetical protein